jgi:hypothetical protein
VLYTLGASGKNVWMGACVSRMPCRTVNAKDRREKPDYAL